MKTIFVLMMSMSLAGHFSFRNPGQCLSQAEAEKILGQPAKLAENTFQDKNAIKQSKCTYTANAKDSKTGRSVNLYYMREEYPNENASHQAYAMMIAQNRNMSGLRKIDGIGSEAFIHTDNENFILLISRKGNTMIRLKVNKLTSTTSVDGIRDVAKEIITE
jgi:hypothetical protein